METECKTKELEFQGLGRRDVVGKFDGGRLSSDAGGLLLLREVSTRTGLLSRFAQCFTDHRDPELIEHTVEDLVGQRVLAQAMIEGGITAYVVAGLVTPNLSSPAAYLEEGHSWHGIR